MRDDWKWYATLMLFLAAFGALYCCIFWFAM
jgi:hypothetical protein